MNATTGHQLCGIVPGTEDTEYPYDCKRPANHPGAHSWKPYATDSADEAYDRAGREHNDRIHADAVSLRAAADLLTVDGHPDAELTIKARDLARYLTLVIDHAPHTFQSAGPHADIVCRKCSHAPWDSIHYSV